jgi:hypothetical protein
MDRSTDAAAGMVVDEWAISRVVHRYALAFDLREWDAVRELFCADAVVDYSEPAGFAGGPVDFVEWAAATMGAALAATQHHITSHTSVVRAHVADALTYVVTQGVVLDGAGGEILTTGGSYYEDRFVRTDDGWRISHRVAKNVWVGDLPDAFPRPPWYGTAQRNMATLPK